MFHHGLSSQKDNKRQKGVAIILSPEFTKAYYNSGFIPPIIPVNENNESFGRFKDLKLVLREMKKEFFRKKSKKIGHQL